MNAEQSDRVTVGVNAEGQKALDALLAETPYFSEEQDAYRFAIAFSIGNGLADQVVPVRGAETKFNIGTLDRDNRLSTLIQTAFPDRADRPYAFAEQLAHVGLVNLRTQLVESHQTLSEILSRSDEEEAAEEGDVGRVEAAGGVSEGDSEQARAVR